MPRIRRGVCQQVEANGKFHVGRIEIRHVLDTVAGNAVKQFIRQVAVRINNGNAMTGFDVLQDQIAEQRRFSRAAFANGV